MISRKNLAGISVVALLVGAPIVSYIYLRTGLEYRLDSMQQLEPKEIHKDLNVELLKLRSEKKASLFHIGSSSSSHDLAKNVADRIKEREFFELLTVSQDTQLLDFDVRLLPNSYLDATIDFVLLDTAGVVRHVYPAGADHSKDIIRHLSVVIPMPKHRTIELRRDVERN